jgi:hypothetical protein
MRSTSQAVAGGRAARPVPGTERAKTILDMPDPVLNFRLEAKSFRKMHPLGEAQKTAFRPSVGKHGAQTATAMMQGPFRVITQEGVDITPGSTLRQAILAVLICAPRQIKSRKSLQDLFWGDAAPERASANLRTALYQLRLDLALLGPDLWTADRQTIGLAPGRIVWGDADVGGAAFLEGLDLPLDGCAGFEDFLRDMRLSGADRDEAAEPAPLAAPSRLSLERPHLALGLLPPIHIGLSEGELHKANLFVDTVVQSLWHVTTMDVHDLRTLDNQIVPLPLSSGKGATHWLQAVVQQEGRQIGLRLRLFEGGTRRLVWLSDPVSDTAAQDDGHAYAMGELLVDRLTGLKDTADAPDLFPISALAAMFSLDPATILKTEAQLDSMLERERSSVLECLHAFVQVFKVHEGIGPAADMDATYLCDRVSGMRTSDPLLPLCQSLLGYALHMVRDDRETALLLIEAANERAPHLAINLDHLAVLRLIRGDVTGASAAVRHCLQAGAFSPWRYTYEVTGAMVCMASGDFRQSLYHSNQALFRQPKYLGALRYSMAGLAISGQTADARRMMARIQSLRPGYDLSSWAEGLLRRAPTHLSQSLVRGMQQSEIL